MSFACLRCQPTPVFLTTNFANAPFPWPVVNDNEIMRSMFDGVEGKSGLVCTIFEAVGADVFRNYWLSLTMGRNKTMGNSSLTGIYNRCVCLSLSLLLTFPRFQSPFYYLINSADCKSFILSCSKRVRFNCHTSPILLCDLQIFFRYFSITFTHHFLFFFQKFSVLFWLIFHINFSIKNIKDGASCSRNQSVDLFVSGSSIMCLTSWRGEGKRDKRTLRNLQTLARYGLWLYDCKVCSFLKCLQNFTKRRIEDRRCVGYQKEKKTTYA